jgi:hypothetical protein
MAAYDPDKVIFTAFGAIADGVVSVEMELNSDEWSQNVSTDGQVLDVKSMDKTGVTRIVLQQSSSFNDVLSAAAAVGAVSPGGLKDLNGSTVWAGFNGRVRKVANAGFGNEATDREWLIQWQKLVPFTGGQD